MNPITALCLYYGYQEGFVYRIKWISKADLPLPHRNGKAVACSGKIYYMGGYCPTTEDVRETSNYEYNPQKDNWTVKANVPIGRSNFAIASFEDRIFVIGGDPVLPNNFDIRCAQSSLDLTERFLGFISIV